MLFTAYEWLVDAFTEPADFPEESRWEALERYEKDGIGIADAFDHVCQSCARTRNRGRRCCAEEVRQARCAVPWRCRHCGAQNGRRAP